jgi:hypothetical protein
MSTLPYTNFHTNDMNGFFKTLNALLQNVSLNHYALPPKLGQVERSSSKPLTRGCSMEHFHLNVCIVMDFILNFQWIHSGFLVKLVDFNGWEWHMVES